MLSWRFCRRTGLWIVIGLTYFAILVKRQVSHRNTNLEIDVLQKVLHEVHSEKTNSAQRQEAQPAIDVKESRPQNIYDVRRNTMLAACRKNGYNGRKTKMPGTDNFSVVRKNALVYCDIAKVASTFWKRVLQIASGKRQKTDVFDIPARAAHASVLETFQNKGFDEIHEILQNSTAFMFVREPYSRLFSGYIDKIFTPRPAYLGLRQKIKNFRSKHNTQKPGGNCALDVTFTEFVRFIAESLTEGSWSNNHFVPMYDLCRPCGVRYDIIGKMETFNEDAKYIFEKNSFPDSIRLDDKKNDLDSITDIVDSTFSERTGMEKCLPFGKALEYVWKKAVIRGILSKEETIPDMFLKSSNFTREDFRKAMTDAYKRSSENPKRFENRKEALVEAIRSVPQNVLDSYRNLFRPDFEIFGYDVDSPDIFEGPPPKPFYLA